ncbi:MAG: ribosome silencing factor [Thiotrichaceae bacterium]|jgi:ribosome-associated protein|uniref:Ribosomal silencing factor RsfS n=1 Tax=Candidatus Thiocaldithrix dubininis TaxID=3080823 RepID=A0AA95H1Q4_9GAMM|nr:MAG: ribosome silencing factor [Candidatus Thiocaldithrix dubininis]
MELEQLQQLVIEKLDDMKAQDIKVIDVRGKSSITDLMIIATGNSTRHVKSLAQTVELAAKEAGVKPLGMEGEQQGDWVLLDLNDVILHVMLANVRDFYNLEKLWEAGQSLPQARVGAA